MKKFFSVLMLAMAIIFVGGQNNFAQARDVYVGTSNTTGWACYVDTDSIYWQNYYQCSATLKMVKSSGRVQNLYYDFMIMQHWTDFKNSQGFSGTVNSSVPIENAMWDFILDYSAKYNLRH